MVATIKPYGMLKEYIGGLNEVSVETGKSIRETIKAIGMPPEVVALVVVNDQQQTKDYLVKDGDIIKLLAVIGGG